MGCSSNFHQRETALGWVEERGSVTNDFSIIKPPVTQPHFFQLWLTAKVDNTVYQIKIGNNTVHKDRKLESGETAKYLNGLIAPSEYLTIIIDGSVDYKLKWIKKAY